MRDFARVAFASGDSRGAGGGKGARTHHTKLPKHAQHSTAQHSIAQHTPPAHLLLRHVANVNVVDAAFGQKGIHVRLAALHRDLGEDAGRRKARPFLPAACVPHPFLSLPAGCPSALLLPRLLCLFAPALSHTLHTQLSPLRAVGIENSMFYDPPPKRCSRGWREASPGVQSARTR